MGGGGWGVGGGGRCGYRNQVISEMAETGPVNKAMQHKKRVAYKYYAHTNDRGIFFLKIENIT